MSAFDPRTASPELRARIQAYGEDWRRAIRSTEPADRPTAEAAITAIYALRGLRPPRFLWVASPAGGLVATRLVGGSGWSSALAEDPADVRWVREVQQRMGDGPLTTQPGRPPSSQPVRHLLALHAAADGILRPLFAGLASRAETRVLSGGVDGRTEVYDTEAARIGTRFLGSERWSQVMGLLGAELATTLLRHAVLDAAHALMNPWDARDRMDEHRLGQFDAQAPYLAASRDVFGHRLGPARARMIDARLAIARSAGPWWATQWVAVVSDRPLRLATDAEGRLHSEDGPALAYRDGFAIHASHGVLVPSWVITDPDRITIHHIEEERNAEVRRTMVERFGAERLIRESGAELVDEDETGRLWRRSLPSLQSWEEPVVMVEVQNSTPEPDGSRRTYFLRVPPDMRKAREAVAWTFSLGEIEYRPAMET
jgi:hypothetical protein